MKTPEVLRATRPFAVFVAVEESAPGMEAIGLAVSYAAQRRTPTELHLVHVVRKGTHDGSAELEQARSWLVRTAESVQQRSPVRVIPHLYRGDAADQIAAVAYALGADLLVVGSHGRTGVRRMVLGSVAEKVMRIAPCPILVARPEQSVLDALPDNAAQGVLPAVTSTIGGAFAGAALGAMAGPIGLAAGAALGASAGGVVGWSAGEEQRETDKRDSLLDEILLGPSESVAAPSP